MLVVVELGSPRSGTSWLQRLLGAHDRIAACQELEFLDRYAWPLIEMFRSDNCEDRETWESRRHKGPPALMLEDEFVAVVRHAVQSVYQTLLAKKPGADLVLDKSPEYSLVPEGLRVLVPDAKVIHVIRDGREVTRSLQRANAGWGRTWAPERLEDAARTWRWYVERARQCAGHPGGYLEVRHDLLRHDPVGQLRQVFVFLDLRCSDRHLKDLIDTAMRAGRRSNVDVLVWSGEVIRRLGAAPVEPDGFFSPSVATDGEKWSGYEEWVFQRTAGELNSSLGFPAEVHVSAVVEGLFKLRLAAERLSRPLPTSRLSGRKVRR